MKTKKNMKIVIVEDDKYYNRALTRYVHTICNPYNYPNFNFEISSYLTAHECLENYEADTGVMILDYILINEEEPNVLTGEDIILEVKRNNPDCKFIMISEQPSPAIVAKLMEYGISEYIDKNISDRNRLGSLLQKLLTSEYKKNSA